MENAGGVFLTILLFVVYFAPSMAAKSRGHRNAQAIFLLNLFLGWTFLGWVAAAVWSGTSNVAEPGENKGKHKTGRMSL